MLTLVIPFRFPSVWLREAVLSVPRPSARVHSLVLVSDGADPDTLSEAISAANAAGWTDRYLLVELGGVGPAAARNAALDVVQTEYVMFLDSDDLLFADGVSEALDTIERTGADVVVGSWIDIFDGKVDTGRHVRPIRGGDPVASALARWWPVSSVVQRATGLRFDTALKIWEVMDFQLRHIVEYQSKVEFTDALLCGVRHHSAPTRVSHIEDHFNPRVSAAIFSAIKARLSATQRLTEEGLSAVDHNLIRFAQGALVRGELSTAVEIGRGIDVSRLPTHSWYEPTGYSGILHTFGPRLGTHVYESLRSVMRLFRRIKSIFNRKVSA